VSLDDYNELQDTLAELNAKLGKEIVRYNELVDKYSQLEQKHNALVDNLNQQPDKLVSATPQQTQPKTLPEHSTNHPEANNSNEQNAHNSGQPSTQLPPEDVHLNREEALKAVNRFRRAHGAPDLEWSDKCAHWADLCAKECQNTQSLKHCFFTDAECEGEK